MVLPHNYTRFFTHLETLSRVSRALKEEEKQLLLRGSWDLVGLL